MGKKSRIASILLILMLALAMPAFGYAEGGEESYEESYSEETYEESYSEETYEESYSEESYSEESYSEEYSGEAEGEGESAQEELDLSNIDTSTPQLTPDGEPILWSSAGLVYCRNTGETLFSKNEDTRYSPYSTTKLITAYLAIQRLPMEQEVKISYEATTQGGASMYLYEGEVLTVEQLLYGTLVLSGNDAAYALGEAVSGDMESFLKLMNETVENLGCKNTHFASPNGMINDVSVHYTTCRDLLEIAKFTLDNEVLAKIAATKEYEIPETEHNNAHKIENHNDLLEKPGYISGKTGYWEDPVRASIAVSYESEGRQFIAVVLDAPDMKTRTADVENMITYAEKNVKGIKAVEIGENAGKVRIRHGEKTRIDAFTGGECVVYLPRQGSIELISREMEIMTDLEAPINKGDVVGTCYVYIADEKVDEVPLVAGETIRVGWFPSYVGISNRDSMIIVGVIGLFLVFFLIRAINQLNNSRRNRRRRREYIRERAEEELRNEKSLRRKF